MPANKVEITEAPDQSVAVIEEDATLDISGTPTVEVTTATEEEVSVVSVGMVGPAGADGTGDKTEVYDQAIAASVWTINHSLSKMPSVTIVNSAGDHVEGDIAYISTSQVKVTFSAAFAGKAYLN